MKNNRNSFKRLSILTLFVLSLVLVNTNANHSAANVRAAPKTVDLRSQITNFNLPVRSQGSRNTCSVYTAIFLLEYETAKATGEKALDFSEDYLDAATDIVKGAQDDGDYFNNIIAGYLTYGVVDQSDFSNSATYNPKNLPSESLLKEGQARNKAVVTFIRENDGKWGITDSQINQIIAQLDAGRAVGAGWRLDKTGIEEAQVLGRSVWNKNNLKGAEDIAGHSMPIVGYAREGESGYFIFRNSAGSGWGDKGYGYCSFDFAKQNIADAFYFAPKTNNRFTVKPQLIKRPPFRYIRLNELQRLNVLRRTNPVIQKNK